MKLEKRECKTCKSEITVLKHSILCGCGPRLAKLKNFSA